MTDAPAIANVVVHVGDMDRALAFYRDALGLSVRFDSGWNSPAPMLALSGTAEGTAMRIVALELSGTAGLSLCSFGEDASSRPAFESAGTIHFGLSVADLPTTLAALESAGGQRLGEPGIVGPPDRRVTLAFVRDPDGAVVELVQHMSAQNVEGGN